MDNKLSHAAKTARNEYYRRWRAANPEKVREKNRRYWEKKAAQASGEKDESKEKS